MKKLFLNLSILLFVSLVVYGYLDRIGTGNKAEDSCAYVYNISYVEKGMGCNSTSELDWGEVEKLVLTNYMGQKPEHLPFTCVKMLYDDNNLYVKFKVLDRYVKCFLRDYHGKVHKDSCVEFFFAPNDVISEGYFNIEINCGGSMLFGYRLSPNHELRFLSKDDCEKIEIVTSLPTTIEDEIKDTIAWTVEYKIPIKILQEYLSVVIPKKGVVWRGNFYKCADETSHPHWLTWAYVDYPRPNFNRPESFGELAFQ